MTQMRLLISYLISRKQMKLKYTGIEHVKTCSNTQAPNDILACGGKDDAVLLAVASGTPFICCNIQCEDAP